MDRSLGAKGMPSPSDMWKLLQRLSYSTSHRHEGDVSPKRFCPPLGGPADKNAARRVKAIRVREIIIIQVDQCTITYVTVRTRTGTSITLALL